MGEAIWVQGVSSPEGVDLWLELQPQPQPQHRMFAESLSMSAVGNMYIKIPWMKKKLQKCTEKENELPWDKVMKLRRSPHYHLQQFADEV
jgi:hypothetical protein